MSQAMCMYLYLYLYMSLYMSLYMYMYRTEEDEDVTGKALVSQHPGCLQVGEVVDDLLTMVSK